MPYDQMSLAPSYATGADGTIHADQPGEKKKKHKGLTKIWKIVTGSSSKDKNIAVHEKQQLDDEPLAPPPPLSYLVARQGGDRAGGGAGGARDLDRRASTPTSSSRSAAPMSPATAPSSILPSPTSQPARKVWQGWRLSRSPISDVHVYRLSKRACWPTQFQHRHCYLS
ncbi:hypothetical protein AG1IA_03471 [Rhizoctonia solani AG-1 IA]|uniref:Uncharacterized protein n=1 Tax=Thanatephorus cucumeris (strain AG1-IA) TaxID=983506 RepID=L8WWI8_THACA|nr:hypothetical protein AG1IA_03471 [Rhizoctonia solani AG-1 IA]